MAPHPPRVKVGVQANHPDNTLRLSELRDLVEAAQGLPDDYIVRGSLVPFRIADLGNPDGGSLQRITVTSPERNPE